MKGKEMTVRREEEEIICKKQLKVLGREIFGNG